MASHNFQVTQGNVPTTHVVAGKLASGVVSAACNGKPAVIAVKNYTFNNSNEFRDGVYIDGNGYRPTITATTSEARAPNFIRGVFTTTTNPIAFFVAADSRAKQTVSVSATAKQDPCGTFDASGSSSFDVPPTTTEELDFFRAATLTGFSLSQFMYFGVGTEASPGFHVVHEAEFLRPGHFGVIQLFKGVYAMHETDPNTGTGRWTNVIDNPTFVLDVKPNAVNFIIDPVRIMPDGRTKTTTLRYGDAPGIRLDELLHERPYVDSVKVEVEMKTYFMFNPSSSSKPNDDTTSIWSPLGTTAITWEAGAQITFNPRKGRKTDPEAWEFKSNYYEMKRLALEFPTWRGRVQHETTDAPVVAQ